MSDGTAERLMRRAVALARRGFPAPNPHVGCVIAQEGQIVGEGWHVFAGGPHAEAVALAAAGEAARGASVYVTLEPCAHSGRTPPCVDALIAAGVGEVFVAVPDPNPVAAGGVERLREAGVVVHVGLGRGWAREANRVFLTAHARRRPFVALKAAITLDGFLARADGTSQWITGPRARREGHRLRAEMGAVLVGWRTVAADDPLLTARLPGVRNQPLRVVLDPHARLTGHERVFQGPDEAWHVVLPDSRRDEAHVPAPASNGAIDLEALLGLLWASGRRGVLVEGGAATLGRFFDARLVDELNLFVAPIRFGEGLPWLPRGGRGATALIPVGTRLLGADVHVIWRVPEN